MLKTFLKNSPADVLRLAHEAFAKPNNAAEQRSISRGVLEHAPTLEYAQSQITHNTSVDVDLITRIITTRCYEMREEYIEDRPQLWFLNMFRDRGLLRPITRGVSAYVTRTYDYAAGPVRFIGDKVDDLPTGGGHMVTPKINQVKYFGASVEYGILELWQAAYEGRDIVGERLRDKLVDFDEFAETLISQGAPLQGFNGFLGHPDIPTNVVPASVANPPHTSWADKTPEEIIFDLQAMRDATRLASNYNTMADTVVLSDARYSYINAAQIGTNGDNILGRWLENERRSAVGGMTNIIPFVPYDTAGSGNTPMALAGRFDQANIEMPFMPPQQLPTHSDNGTTWKVGFIGGAGSVNVKRSGRFQQFEGI